MKQGDPQFSLHTLFDTNLQSGAQCVDWMEVLRLDHLMSMHSCNTGLSAAATLADMNNFQYF